MPMAFVALVRIWIVVSALATIAGWSLSAVGQLNRGGYLVFGGLVAVCFLIWRKTYGGGRRCPQRAVAHSKLNDSAPRTNAPYRSLWKRLRSRFRRPWPFCFALLALLIFLGAAF